MYYESRINTLEDITKLPLDLQAKKVKALGIGSGVQIQNIIFINDANPSGCGISEVAIIYEQDNDYYAFESMTVEWMKEKDIEVAIKEYITYTLNDVKAIQFVAPTTINNIEKQVYFTCGCCGDVFKSTIAQQVKFDQDSGYGICDSCEASWY